MRPFLRAVLSLALALGLGACAAAPAIQKARLDGIQDPSDALKRYYDERLTPSPEGYLRKGQSYDAYELPRFYDVQGATTCADWARSGRDFKQIGWGAAGFIFAAGLGISAFADINSPQRQAWWLSLLPAGLVGWTFHWIGFGWFTQPSVALYNKDLAKQLGMTVVPVPDPEAP